VEGLGWLDQLPDFERDRRVVRSSPTEVRRAARSLGLFDAGLRFVHVVGTNGKGSTAGLAAVMLTGLGYRTGVFRSPHLCGLDERVMVNAAPVALERLDEELVSLRRLTESGLLPALTRFEVLVLAALSMFALEGCEIAVVEAGLGGREDATNILDAETVVLTSVGHDHLEQLGPTLEDVLAHKLGVVGPGSRVIAGRLAPELAQRAAGLVGAERLALLEAMELERAPGVGGQEVRFAHFGHRHTLFLPAFGQAAADNLALAVSAVELLLGVDIDDARLGPIVDVARLVGCMEVVGRHPLVVVDTAHNPEAARNLGRALEEAFGAERSLGLVLGMSHGRDPQAFLEALAPVGLVSAVVCECGVEARRIERALAALYPEARVSRWPEGAGPSEIIALAGTEMVLVTGSHCACREFLCRGRVTLVRE
jgi:dihydrofolate synthase/folylpolyglutamate synthase